MIKENILPAIMTALALTFIVYTCMIAIDNCFGHDHCSPIIDMMVSRERAIQECEQYNKNYNGSYCYV